jgi:sec-independent protein translocase protein TatA
MDLWMAFFQNLGIPEILIISAVGLLLFGSRLPQVGRSLGRSIVQFKKGLRDVQDEVDEAVDEPEKPASKSKNEGSGRREPPQPPAG